MLQFKLPLNESNIFSPAIATNIFLKKKNISRISLFTNQFLQEDFTDFVIDDIKPEAIILGDLFKEFNWEKLNKVFQTILENNALIIALHKNRYCKRENKLSLDLGPFVAALEYATSKKSFHLTLILLTSRVASRVLNKFNFKLTTLVFFLLE